MSHIYDSLCFFAMWNEAFEGCTFRISAVIWFSSKITSQRKKVKKSPNQARFIFDAVSRRNYYLLLKHMQLHFSGPIRKSKWSFEQKKTCFSDVGDYVFGDFSKWCLTPRIWVSDTFFESANNLHWPLSFCSA